MKVKPILVMALVVLAVCISAIIGAKAYIGANLEELAHLKLSAADLSKAADGIYEGSYKVFPVAAVVELKIDKHRITEIKLIRHENGQGSAAEAIPGRVVEAQSLDVDIVAGATYSSKVILKAIENALLCSYR